MSTARELEICGTRLSSLGDTALQERVLRGLMALEARGAARCVDATLVGDTWRVCAEKAEEAHEALLGMGVPATMLRRVRP